MADPGTGTLTLTTTDAEFTNSGDMRLVLTGHAPVVVNTDSDKLASPTVGSLALTFYEPERAYGLQLTGQSLGITVSMYVAPPVVALQLTGVAPFVEIGVPPAITPTRYEMAIDGYAPSISISLPSVTIPVANLAFGSTAPNLIIGIEQGIVALRISSTRPTVSLSGTLGLVGTIIENTNAAEYDGRYNICQRSGFKALPGELVRDAYGNLVLPKYRDYRHPQELGRSTAPEKHHGPKRREPEPEYIEDLYPDGVSIDDL